MPVVTTLHAVATKRAEVGTVRHRSPSSQNTALSFGKVQRFLLLSFVAVSVCLLCHTDTTDFYTIRLSGISPTSCYKTKNTPRSHAAITVVLAFAAYAASREFGLLCILLPLSHRRLCDLRCFSCGLLARLRKSCSSKSPQPFCNRGIFTAEPNLLASVSPGLFGTSPPTEMRLRAILLQTRSLYMWA